MKRLASVVVVLLVGVAGGFGLATLDLWPSGGALSGKTPEASPKTLYWVAPMDANYRRDGPGKSPMGMDLVPVYEEGEGTSGEAQEGSVSINPAVVNNIGVRLAKVEVAAMRPTIRTIGRITFDETRVARVHLRSTGWVERLVIRSEGEPVKKGDLLLEVYSPDLVNAQSEFLRALQGGRPDRVDASRDRLRALDIAETQISQVEQSRKPQQYTRVYAPIDGIVTALNVAEGQFVKPETQMFALADISVVWLISDVFEADANQVHAGAAVTVRTEFDPGNEIEGVVDYVYPDLDPVTRTAAVRTVLTNEDGRLKPGMFMSVAIEGPQRPETTVIPREALIRTGDHERVILSLGGGRFRPAAVVSGIEVDGRVEILSGLSPGEQVVASGQFLIDSESSFAGASLRLQTPEQESLVQEANGNGTLNRMADDKSSDKLVQAHGVLVEISESDRSVKLKHGPIPALGWKAMTMNLPVAKGVDLSALQPGMRVRFKIAPVNGNRYAIHEIEVAP